MSVTNPVRFVTNTACVPSLTGVPPTIFNVIRTLFRILRIQGPLFHPPDADSAILLTVESAEPGHQTPLV